MEKDLQSIPCHYLKLRRGEEMVRKFYDSYLKPSSVTIAQFFLLRQISANEGCSVRQLSDRTLLDRSTLARTLKPLFAAGLIFDAKAPGARNSRLALTPHGQSVLNDAGVRWEQAQKAFEEKIGRSRVEVCEKIIAEFAKL